MSKIRTLNKAIEELKKFDPDCCLTLSALRRMIRCNKIPYTMSGNKYLVDIEELPLYLFKKEKIEGN